MIVDHHDQKIEILTDAVSKAVASNETLTRKIEDMVDALSQQNVLAERLLNIKDAVSRAHKRIDKIENTQSTTGGAAVALLKKESEANDKSNKEQIKHIDQKITRFENRIWWLISLVGGAIILDIVHLVVK